MSSVSKVAAARPSKPQISGTQAPGPQLFESVEDVVASLEPSYPVYCLRPALLEANARQFISLFPGTALYAVKCNPHPLVLKALYRGGFKHFDTASLPEIAQVAELFDDASAYFMHPVKSRAVIKSAHWVYGISHFVVDHENELTKVLEETGGTGITVVVRLTTPPADKTLYHLSAKFGAAPKEAAALLARAAEAGCATGLAFHVGSQCRAPDAYHKALAIAGAVLKTSGAQISVLDIGGGFPSDYPGQDAPPLEDYMAAVRAGLKEIALPPTVEVFSEPGRALVAEGCSLLTQIQLRKDKQLYINDGIYGSLSEMVAAGIELPARLIRAGKGKVAKRTVAFTLNGPTCDSLDVLPGTFALPADAREGDWIEIFRVGAYSNSNATHFNGFFPETFVEVAEPPREPAR